MTPRDWEQPLVWTLCMSQDMSTTLERYLRSVILFLINKFLSFTGDGLEEDCGETFVATEGSCEGGTLRIVSCQG